VAAVHLIPHYLFIFVDLCLAKMSHSSRIYSNCPQKPKTKKIHQIKEKKDTKIGIDLPLQGDSVIKC